MTWLAVGVGGAIGSLARHLVNIFFGHVLGRWVPDATLTVNVAGSFVIGLLAGLVAHGGLSLSPLARAFVFVGVLGGFTTFSSFTLDTLTLSHGGYAAAFWNVAAHMVLGLAAVFCGYYLGVRPAA